MYKALFAAGALALSAASTEAATMQAVFIGQITRGFDGLGVFASPGSSLDNRDFVLSLIYDTDKGQRQRTPGSNDTVTGSAVGSPSAGSPVGTVSVGIDDGSSAFEAFQDATASFRQFGLGGEGPFVAFFVGNGSMSVAAGITQRATVRIQMVADKRFFVTDLEANQTLDLADVSLDSVCVRDGAAECRFSFDQIGSDSSFPVQTFGELSPTKLTITRLDDPIVPVPLPSAALLLGTAVCGVVALRRRLRKAL